jgi:FeS assembly SUF system regulator, gammaproteobacterial
MIRMSKLTDYGIVLLTYFATQEGGTTQNARDLAARARLPLATVGKVLKILARGELLVSHRGARGGYRLARDPAEISLADIIAALEGPVAMTECSAAPPGGCEQEGWCPTKSTWQRINQVVLDSLGRITLSELTASTAGGISSRGKGQRA